jgi:hypothetical protein
MLNVINHRRLKLTITTMIVFSVAAAVPEKGQIVQLQDFINGRGDKKFRAEDNNRIYELPKGTIGQIDPKEEIVEFKKDPITKIPKAYGLCIKILNATVSNKRDCYWVYYMKERGNIEILDKDPIAAVAQAPKVKPKTVSPDYQPATESKAQRVSQREVKGTIQDSVAPAAKPSQSSSGSDGVVQKIRRDNQIQKSTVVQIIAPTVAVREPARAAPATPPIAAAPAKATDSKSGKPNEEAMNRSAATIASRLSSLNQAINPEVPPELNYGCDSTCNHKKVFSSDEMCTKKNDYLEKDIERLKNTPDSIIQKLFQTSDRAKYIKDECFGTALKNIGGIPYKTCVGNQVKNVVRPCASNDLKLTTRKAFDMTMSCLGEYYTDGETSVESAASNFFFLISHESGHNPNAVSTTGAGGSTQVTDPFDDAGKPAGAITYVNKVEKKLMLNHLAKKNDPRCEPVKTALERGMSSGFNTCDRISLDRGNPLMNLVYGLAIQKYLRANVQAYITENPLAVRVFGRMSPEIKDYVEGQLGMWSHNLGEGGMRRAAQSYLATHASRFPILTTQDADKMFLELKKHIRTKDRDPAEPIKFLKEIADKKKQIESTVGVGTCAVTSK